MAILVHSSLEHSVSALEANTEFQKSLWLNFNVYHSLMLSEENDGALSRV